MIALYCRVSSREQAENGYSVNEQQDRLKKYCEALGWKNHECFVDAGFTGANTNRPALNRLIKAVQSHKVNKVLVYKLDRLSRSQKDTLKLIEDVFLKNDCDFVSISENFDTATPLGRAMIGILAVFAQLEREQIKERMYMGHEARAKQGKFSGTRFSPTGYDYIDGQLVVNEYEKAIIQRIYQDYLSGNSINSIVVNLNKEGLYHKIGEWNTKTLVRILTSRLYIGEIMFSKEWYQGTHEPIIDKETFDKVQERYSTHYHEFMDLHRRSGKYSSYLGGFIYCARCGEKYSKIPIKCKGKYTYNYYVCNSHGHRTKKKNPVKCKNKFWKMEKLDDLIFNEIRKLSLEPDLITPEPVKDNSVIEKKIKDIDKQISRLMDLYSVGNMPLNTIKEKVDALNDQRNKLEDSLNEPPRMSKQDAVEVIATLNDVLCSGDLDEIHDLVGALIERIDIDGEDITIKWNF